MIQCYCGRSGILPDRFTLQEPLLKDGGKLPDLSLNAQLHTLVMQGGDELHALLPLLGDVQSPSVSGLGQACGELLLCRLLGLKAMGEEQKSERPKTQTDGVNKNLMSLGNQPQRSALAPFRKGPQTPFLEASSIDPSLPTARWW